MTSPTKPSSNISRSASFKPAEDALTPAAKDAAPTENAPAVAPAASPEAGSATPLAFVQEDPAPPIAEGSDPSFENDTPKGLENYEDRYVAFVDILGFKELIRESQKDAGKVAQLVSALDVSFTSSVHSVVLEELEVDEDQVDVRVYTFSDFVVVSTKPTAAGLSTLLYIVWVLSSRWLSSQILCRGGITRGQLLHRVGDGPVSAMAFGPAFIEAYLLESSTADYPRVILGKPARRDWDQYKRDDVLGSKIPLLVRKCADGPICIDIFCHLKENGFTLVSDANPIEAGQMREALLRHLDETAETPSIHRKTLWLANKFNDAIVDTRYAHLKLKIE